MIIFNHKPCGTAAFVRDKDDRILLVKATYRSYWTLPGGIVERGESPLVGCLREAAEETGLKFARARLLCLDWRKHRNGRDSLHFIFDCGIVTDEQAASIRPQPREIAECRWMSLEEALPLLNEHHRRRVPRSFEAALAGQTVYLENGELTN